MRQIEAVHIVAILEVVDEVPCHRVLAIVKSTHVAALTCSSEICLKSWRACVEHRHSVSIVRPHIPEGLFKLLELEDFEGLTARLLTNTHLRKLYVSNLARENRLDDVCSIEAIHAVGAHDADLGLHDFAGRIVNELALSKTNLHFCHKVAIAKHLLFYDVD